MSQGYSSTAPAQPASPSSPGSKLAFHLQNGHTQSMDARQSDYQQPGLHSPYSASTKIKSERSAPDQTSAAQYPPGQDPRNANFSSSATPTSDYGIAPSSARSGSFPEYIQRSPYPPQGQGTPAGNMAQATSPSIPLHNDQAINPNPSSNKSDADLPIDPSIAAASPTYPHHPSYSPYTPNEAQPMYGQHPGHFPRSDWPPGHYQTPPTHIPPYGHAVTTGPPTPAMVSPVQRPPTVSCPWKVGPDPQRRLAAPLTSHRVVILCRPFTRLSRFRVHNSTNVRVGATRRSSACTSAVGMDVKRPMER